MAAPGVPICKSVAFFIFCLSYYGGKIRKLNRSRLLMNTPKWDCLYLPLFISIYHFCPYLPLSLFTTFIHIYHFYPYLPLFIHIYHFLSIFTTFYPHLPLFPIYHLLSPFTIFVPIINFLVTWQSLSFSLVNTSHTDLWC